VITLSGFQCTFNKKLDFVSNNFCHSGIVALTVELKGTQPFIPFLLLLLRRRLEQKKLFDTKTSKDESHCRSNTSFIGPHTERTINFCHIIEMI
jgi:hypothetical protein